MEKIVFLNNKWVPEKQALISIRDRGFLFGDGIFETVRVYDGTPFLLDRHLRRFFASAEKLEIEVLKTPEDLVGIIECVLKENKLSDACVRITLSRGLNVRGIDICENTPPTLVVEAVPFSSYSFNNREVCFVRTRKNSPEAIDPTIKSANFLNSLTAKREAVKKGCFEGIMLSVRGYVAEGSISNVFWVNENVLSTPDLSVGILPGITREVVLEIAREKGIDVCLGHFPPDDLLSASEVFLTNSLMEIMPVVCNEWKKPHRANSEITNLLKEEYRKKVGLVSNFGEV